MGNPDKSHDADRHRKSSRRDDSEDRSSRRQRARHRSRSTSHDRNEKSSRRKHRSPSPRRRRGRSASREKDRHATSRNTSEISPSAPAPGGASSSTTTSQLQAEIAAKMASVTSFLSSANMKHIRKPAYIPLLLDAQGRQIDDEGKLVKMEGPVKTLVANVAVGQAKKKKENPYLAHRTHTNSSNALPKAEEGKVADANVTTVLTSDPRLKLSNRDTRGRKALSFVEAGTYVKAADAVRHKEDRKVIAGYSSGRRAPEALDVDDTAAAPDDAGDAGNVRSFAATCNNNSSLSLSVPPPADGGVVPALEWWDEAFLPKDLRELRKRSRAAKEQDDFSQLLLSHCRTFKYIQHPLAVRPLGGDKHDVPLELFLTKKERKRIRRTARQQRELEKRDQLMMGLIPAPEPKFKLSNFMKLLGDQAVADPSLVEARVQQQMRQRITNHEMRNAAKKLTPAERREKKRKKLTEDTSRQVHVAILNVRDFSDPKHRFKVDVNAQQYNITGTVILCPSAGTNLVVAEGGPIGIRKLVRLMLHRVPWNKASEQLVTSSNSNENGDEGGSDASDDEGSGESAKIVPPGDTEGILSGGDRSKCMAGNECLLLWQGIVAKRTFHAFKFQECRSGTSARKVLEAKGSAHYWDMAARCDEIIAASRDIVA